MHGIGFTKRSACYDKASRSSTPRLPVASAHEPNHIVRFALEPFVPGLTLGKYLVAEGLAESFGLEIVGDASLVGPYCTALAREQVKTLKPRYQEALQESDFSGVRGYIFGDWVAERLCYPNKACLTLRVTPSASDRCRPI